jgi:hypothetical protein
LQQQAAKAGECSDFGKTKTKRYGKKVLKKINTFFFN